jgi:hypothetical protein
MPVPTYERTQYEQNMEMSRKNLDDATFTKVWAEGRAMTMEQAIDYALELQDD